MIFPFKILFMTANNYLIIEPKWEGKSPEYASKQV